MLRFVFVIFSFNLVTIQVKLPSELVFSSSNLEQISKAFSSVREFPVTSTISSNNFEGIPNQFIRYLHSNIGPVGITELFFTSSEMTFVFLNNEFQIYNSCSSFWVPKFYFFLHSSKFLNDFKIFSFLWEMFNVRNVFLVSESEFIYYFNPTVYKVEELRLEVGVLKNIFKKRMCCWNESEVHIVFSGKVPFANNSTNQLSNILDDNLVRNIAEMLNSSLFLKGTSDQRRYGMKFENGTYIGTFKDLIKNYANVTGNRHFIKWYNISPELTFTHYISSDKLCFAIPKAGQIPHLLASLESFKSSVILYLMLSYIAAGISFNLITKFVEKAEISEDKRSVSTVFMMISFLLNMSFPYKPSMMYENFFITIMLMISFILVNLYQSSLITILTAPSYYKNIQSLEELKKIDIEIWTSSEDLISSLNAIGLSDLNYHLKTTYEQQHSNNTFDKGWLEKLTIFEDVEQLSYVHGKSYIVPECPLSYLTAYVIPSESVLENRLNIIISRLIESGHILRWTRYIYETNESEIRINQVKDKSDIKAKPLTFNDLASCFKIIGWSFLIASLVFICEIIIHALKVKK